MTPPLGDGQHDQLPPHIRKGIEDQLARMRAEELIGAAAADRAAGPVWFGYLILLATLLCGMGLVALFITIGEAVDGGREHMIINTPTTYGAP